jgi:5-(carboxyamino)imidazole ribonucleotide synthase
MPQPVAPYYRLDTAMTKTLLPGTSLPDGRMPTLGVMGGGQLGRMFVQAAQRMGYFTAVLDPDPASPAGKVSHYHIQTDYLDEQGLAQLMQRSAAITTEFENVPAPALMTLGAHRTVAPNADCVAVAQDRRAEKAHFTQCAQTSGVGPVPCMSITQAADLAQVSDKLLPGILKTASLGYDGKGQATVLDRAQLEAAFAQFKGTPCVLEKRMPLVAECSVILARGADGACVSLPVQRNVHVNGILAITEVYEGNMPQSLINKAQAATQCIANSLDYVGVLCVEFFAMADTEGKLSDASELMVNEMAPRPHNSGHYSMDACDVSQFDLQVRALCGLPLTTPRQHSPAVMLNLLGDLWFKAGDKAQSPAWAEVLALPGTHLHLYGKLDARRGRKMGHLNIIGTSMEAVRSTAKAAAQILGLAY